MQKKNKKKKPQNNNNKSVFKGALKILKYFHIWVGNYLFQKLRFFFVYQVSLKNWKITYSICNVARTVATVPICFLYAWALTLRVQYKRTEMAES